MTDAEKERIKYLATLLNTCAAACFTIGVAGPIAAALYGAPLHIAPGLYVVEALGWLSAAFFLTFVGQTHPGAAPMNGLQVFAFIAMPIAVAAVGWIVAFMVAPIDRSPKADEQSLSGPHRHHA